MLITGTYNLVASYPGDPNFAARQPPSVGTLTVTPASASSLTLALTPSGTSVAYGNESAVTYSVSLGSATPTPTGTVAVTTTTAGNTVTLCTVTLTAGAGTCAVSSPTLLAVSATNPVVATYTGDANYSGHGRARPRRSTWPSSRPRPPPASCSPPAWSPTAAESATSITATVTPGLHLRERHRDDRHQGGQPPRCAPSP